MVYLVASVSSCALVSAPSTLLDLTAFGVAPDDLLATVGDSCYNLAFCISCKALKKSVHRSNIASEKRILPFYFCLTCWADEFVKNSNNRDNSDGIAPVMLCEACSDLRSVCHPWDHVFLCADATAEYSNTPLDDLVRNYNPPWHHLKADVMEGVLKKAGIELRGVKGKSHDEVCTSCSRSIIGTRFSRLSNYVEGSLLTKAHGEESLCQECYIDKKERGDSAKRGADLDPYWVIIPSLWQFGDSDIGEMMQGSALRKKPAAPVVEEDAPYQPSLRTSDYTPTKNSSTGYAVAPSTTSKVESASEELKPADDYTDSTGSFDTSSYTAYAANSAQSSYQSYDEDTPSSAYAMDPKTYVRDETPYQAYPGSQDTPYQAYSAAPTPLQEAPLSAQPYQPYDGKKAEEPTSYQAFEEAAQSPTSPSTNYSAFEPESSSPQSYQPSSEKKAEEPTSYQAFEETAQPPTSTSTSYSAFEPESSATSQSQSNTSTPYQAYSPDAVPSPEPVGTAYTAYSSSSSQTDLSAPTPYSSAPKSYSSAPTSYSSAPTSYSNPSSPSDPYFGNKAPSVASSSTASQASSVAAPVPTVRGWNEEFQRLFDSKPSESSPLEDRVLYMQTLQALSRDFITTAERIGKIIIDEVHVPAANKTIKPANMGGVAGGEKYLVEGIFFKFAIDAFGVYGGDDFAMKAAGHELNGLKAYHAVSHLLDAPNGNGLHFPFMVLISYRGYRLIGTPKLPLGPGSLIYGSADAGKTVHRSNDGMNDLMKQAARILNIKEHGVGLSGDPGSDEGVVMLDAPTDIEGHLGGDSRYYLLDTARICPPEPPRRAFMAVKITADTLGEGPWGSLPRFSAIELNTAVWKRQLNAILLEDPALNGERVIIESRDFLEGTLYYLQQTQKVVSMLPINSRASTLVEVTIYGDAVLVVRGRKGAFLYNLMPYELVKAYGKAKGIALSSDAFTQFGRHKSGLHNEEVFDCFYWLLGEHIPKFVGEVLQENRPLNQNDLVTRMHSWGINLRLLGFVRALFRTPKVSKSRTERTIIESARGVLLVEMIARTSKSYIRSRVRSVKTLEESIRLVIQHFNVLFGRSRASTFFWHTFVKIQLAAKYDVYGPACLTEEELAPKYDLRQSLSLLMLFQLLKADVGVAFTMECQESFEKNPSLLGSLYTPIHREDVVGFLVQTRHLLEDSLKASTNELVRRYVDEKSLKPGSDEELKILKEFLGASPVEYSYHFLKRAYEAKRAGRFDESVERDVNLSLEAFVEEPSTCPYEIAVKAFFIKGCLAEMRGDFARAEAFYRTVYDALVNIAGQADSFIASDRGLIEYVPLETNAFFALVILEQWVGLLLKAGRMLEAYILSCKFAKLNLLIPSPGFPEEIARGFDRIGQSPSLALSLFSQSFAQFDTSKHHLHEAFTKHYFDQIERRADDAKVDKTKLTLAMNLKPGSVEYRLKISTWHDMLHLVDPSNWSGFTLSPLVLDEDVQLIYNSSPKPVYGFKRSSLIEYSHHGACFYVVAKKTMVELSEAGTATLDFEVHIPGRLMDESDSSEPYPYRLILLRTDSPIAVETFAKDRGGLQYKEYKNFAAYVSPPLQQQIGTAARHEVKISDLKLSPGVYAAIMVKDNSSGIGQTVLKTISSEVRVTSQKLKSYVVFHSLSFDHLHFEPMFEDRKITAFAFSEPWEYGDTSPKVEVNIVVATDDGKVYEFGREDNGKKLTGYRNYLKVPDRRDNVPIVTDKDTFFELRQLSAYRISDLAASGTHFLAVTQTKELLAWGSNNKHGPLGQGDSDARLQPRLIEKLKGVRIEKAFAFSHRSFALDQNGLLYQWGKGAGLFPAPSKYFQSEDVQSLTQIAFCDYDRYTHYPAELVKKNAIPDQTVFYLTRLGEVYWSNDTHTKPAKLIATYDLFVVQIAAGAGHLLALTDDGQVYAMGLWENGEFANFPDLGGEYSKRSSEGLPLTCTKVGLPAHVKVVQIGAVGHSCCALDQDGKLWYWGNGHFAPFVPVALRDHTISKFALDGVTVMATCGRLPSPIEVDPKSFVLRDEKRALSGREDVHRIEVQQDPQTLALTLEWHRPPGDILEKEVLEFVQPGEDSFPGKSGIREIFAMRLLVPKDKTLHAGKIVVSYNTNENDKAIKLPDGEYEVVYWGGDTWGTSKRVFARSSAFTLRTGEPTLSAPAEVEPQKPFKVHFKIPHLLGGHAEQLYRISAVNKEGKIFHQHFFQQGKAKNEDSYDVTLYIAGDYELRLGLLAYDDNDRLFIFKTVNIHAEVKLDLYRADEIEFKTSEDLSSIEKGSKFKLDYSFDPKSPHKLTQYNEWFGVWKPEAAESTWPPQFGFPGMIAHEKLEGTYEVTAPAAVGQYELRILSINGGNYRVLKRLGFTAIAEKPKPLPDAASPSPAPVTASDPPSSAPSAQAPIQIAIEPIKVPSYSNWEELLNATAIPPMFHTAYKMVFSAQKIPMEKLKSFDYPFLASIGIAMPAHQLEIMSKANEIKDAEQKKFIQEEIARQMAALRK